LHLVLDTLLVAATLLFLRSSGGSADRVAAALVLAGVGIFVLVVLTGAPTARRPELMLLNVAVLLAVAVTLLVTATRLALRAGHGAGRGPAALGIVALVVGSTGYLANLLARWAVVLAGASGLQAQVEETAWVAYAYLPGLVPEPTPLALLLVWLDLLQVAYVVLTYLGFGALATALGRTGHIRALAAARIGVAGVGLAGLVGVAAVLAGAVAGPASTVAAWTAFVLTIPFMSTVLPYALGVSLLRGRSSRNDHTRPPERKRMGASTSVPQSSR